MKNKKEKKILVIAEGEKTEPQIYRDPLVRTKLFPEDVSIFSYKASLHDLIQLLEEYQEDRDFVDLQKALIAKEREKGCADSAEQIKKLKEEYTDTILLFDLDPQDSRYNAKKVISLLEVFNESSYPGKLYLSYPMIEALFDDRDSVPFPFKVKGEYKNHVKNNNLYRNFTKDKLTFNGYQDILKNQFAKAKKITPYNEKNFHLNLFDKQSWIIDNKKKIYVISTALFFLIDYWGEKIMQVNSPEEL